MCIYSIDILSCFFSRRLLAYSLVRSTEGEEKICELKGNEPRDRLANRGVMCVMCYLTFGRSPHNKLLTTDRSNRTFDERDSCLTLVL
jgi:hypothetical protein